MDALAKLLEPVLPADFFRERWNQRALHVPGPAGKFADIYDADTWTRFEGVAELKAVTIDARGVQHEMAALTEQAGTLFMSGYTICANVTRAPKLAPFLSGFRAALPGPGEPPFAKLYASADGRGFAVHADKHHVFVLQISGKKLWRYSRAPVAPSPVDGLFLGADGLPHWTNGASGEPARLDDGTPIPPPDEGALETALLEPGHLLYLPPGTWHVARAVGHSIAVSVSPQCDSVADLFVDVLRELVAGSAEWRRELVLPPSDAAEPGAVPAPVAAFLHARADELRAAIARLDERRVHRLWQSGVARAQADTSVTPRTDDREVRRSDLFARVGAEPFRFLVAPPPEGGDDRCYFYKDGEWTLPVLARALLTKLAAQDGPFRAEDALAWDRQLKFQQVRDVLATLVAAGVLERR